jgi:hypothetical protein
MHRATTVRHPAMRHLDLSGDLFGAVSGGLRAGCGLLSTGRSGLGCGGSLHWAELAVASQNLVRANGGARSGLAIAGRPASNGQGKSSSVVTAITA